MGYDDSYYYGQNKLICTSSSSADEGKAVSVVSMSGRSWSGVLTNGMCTFLLPPRDAYTITLMNGDDAQHTITEAFGFGECKLINIGIDESTPEGIRAILNAGKEDEYFKVGDQVLVNENGANVLYDILHINYTGGINANSHNIIFGRHFVMDGNKLYNQTANTKGGFLGSYIYDYLNGSFFNSLSLAWRNAIEAGGLPFTFMGGFGNGQTIVQETPSNIFLPTEYNVDSVGANASPLERTDANGSVQFSLYSDPAKRIKTYENTDPAAWWLSSPAKSNSSDVVNVNTSGIISVHSATFSSIGVMPCFMLRSDN